MGALVTRALRPVRTFNIDNRAERVISQEKPSPAPRYPQNIEDLKRTIETVPDLDLKLDTKNEDLDLRLKDVYVTSYGRPEDDITREKQAKTSADRPLPQSRKVPPEYEFGFKEPDQVTYGRITLRDAVNFISAHQINPNEVTAAKIALEYNLKLENVENILKYFKTFEIYLPETKQTPATFAGPSMLRKQLSNMDSMAIDDKEKGKSGETDRKEI